MVVGCTCCNFVIFVTDTFYGRLSPIIDYNISNRPTAEMVSPMPMYDIPSQKYRQYR
jgi:hypothetical protein